MAPKQVSRSLGFGKRSTSSAKCSMFTRKDGALDWDPGIVFPYSLQRKLPSKLAGGFASAGQSQSLAPSPSFPSTPLPSSFPFGVSSLLFGLPYRHQQIAL